MHIEYEATFIEIDVDTIKQRLKKLDAFLVKPKTLYKRANFENDIVTKNLWLRLRDEGDSITLTLKQVLDKTHMRGTQELSITVNDFKTTVQLLKKIGMQQKQYQENYREIWELDQCEITFNTWPDIPTFMEIEGPDEQSVIRVAEQLELDMHNAYYGSIGNLYQDVYNRDISKEPILIFDK